MRLRFFSAFVAIAILLPLIYWGGVYAIYLLSFLVMLGACLEYKNMILEHRYRDLSLVYYLLSSILFLRFLYSQKNFFMFFVVANLFFWVYSIIRYSVLYKETNNNRDLFSILAALSIGLLYIPITIVFIAKIRGLHDGLLWLVFFLSIVWAGDSGAYFFGRFMGKKKLSPGISPNKTIEGSIGSIFSSLFVGVVLKVLVLPQLGFLDVFILSTVGNALAQIGDLFESLLKRAFGIKDSGTFMPGHGGFLDRFDGIMFAAPFFYYYIERFFS